MFYAQGVNRWSYDATKGMFTHQSNTYSKAGYYFVTSAAGTGKKIMDKTVVLPASPTIHTVEEFVSYQVYEKDLINLTNSGKEFYGEKFDAVTSYTLPFTFPNPVLTNSTTVRLNVAYKSYIASAFTINLNGEQLKTLNASAISEGDMYTKGRGVSSTFQFTPQSESFGFNLSYNKPNLYSIGYLNYLEVNAKCQLKMTGSVMPFQNIDYLGTNSYSKYLLSNANANVQIWDITDPANIGKMVTENIDGKMAFVASGNEETHYIAIDPTASASFAKPEIIGTIPNQDLHGITQADMLIITHLDFVAQAETLAQAHRQKDNLTVAVVTTDQVYNEFSSGTPDATAYRRIIKNAL
ncbi:MAG: C25 family cysteine peptidase [Paludibacter sp.]